ncbi:hypothetical protein BU16DRAFT_596949 [Lophium mytilinum]|uniref:Uncharacterized protein n=1 Tax=Lophium mytilinum TaxID=390894 RepID=A0A6A6QE09_9PEZI|nr:hypothetical protein BU16DRAFT_596949 [Lophium mytilinum]
MSFIAPAYPRFNAAAAMAAEHRAAQAARPPPASMLQPTFRSAAIVDDNFLMRHFPSGLNLHDAIEAIHPSTTTSGTRLQFGDAPATSSAPNVSMPPFQGTQAMRRPMDEPPAYRTKAQPPSAVSDHPAEQLKAMLHIELGESLEARLRRELRKNTPSPPEALEVRLLRQLRGSVATPSNTPPNIPSDYRDHQWLPPFSAASQSSVQSRPTSPGNGSDTSSNTSSLGPCSSVSQKQGASMSASPFTLGKAVDSAIIDTGNVRPRPSIDTPPSSITASTPLACDNSDVLREALVTKAKYDALQEELITARKETADALAAKAKVDEILQAKAIEEEQEDALRASFAKLPRPGAPVELRELRGHYTRLRKEKDQLKKENDELKKELRECDKACDFLAKDHQKMDHEKHHIIHEANAQTALFLEERAEAKTALRRIRSEVRLFRAMLADRNEQLEEKTKEAERWKGYLEDFQGFLDVAKVELGPESNYMQDKLEEEIDERDTVDYLKGLDEEVAQEVSSFIQFGREFPSPPSHDPDNDPDPDADPAPFDDPLALRGGIGWFRDAEDVKDSTPREQERLQERLRLLLSNKENIAREIVSGGYGSNEEYSAEEISKLLDIILSGMDKARHKIVNPAIYKGYKPTGYKAYDGPEVKGSTETPSEEHMEANNEELEEEQVEEEGDGKESAQETEFESDDEESAGETEYESHGEESDEETEDKSDEDEL